MNGHRWARLGRWKGFELESDETGIVPPTINLDNPDLCVTWITCPIRRAALIGVW